MKLLALILFLAAPRQDPQLAAVRATLMSLRDSYGENQKTRGAAADLTVAKHQLRDWVESHLTKLGQNGDTLALAQQMHNEIDAAQLYCVDEADECFDNSLGYLDDVKINREGEFLIIRTAIGIFCAFDYSAYVYIWKPGGWQRVWENEQNTYSEKEYLPQIIYAVHISVPDKQGNRLVMTLGSRSGCTPAYLPVYYRVWQMNSDYRTGAALLDGSETALDDGYPPIQGRVGRKTCWSDSLWAELPMGIPIERFVILKYGTNTRSKWIPLQQRRAILSKSGLVRIGHKAAGTRNRPL